MVSALAIDIETVPTEAAMSAPYLEEERQPPSNYKNAETIAGWREKDRQAWELERVKQYSLSPLDGRVVAIGVAFESPDGLVVQDWQWAKTEADETHLLNWLWSQVAEAELMVTWNGFNFDIPFLLTRSAIHSRWVPNNRWLRRYSTDTHYDVRQVVNGWQSTKAGTLDQWARAFGLGGKVATGADVYPMFQRGELAQIGMYSADDAAKTLRLYHRVQSVFG